MKFPIRIVSRARYEQMKYAKEALPLYNRLRELQKSEQSSGGIIKSCALDVLKNAETFNILDVGANCGAWSLAFLSFFPKAISYAIEADPETYKVLCKNTASQTSIHPINALLSSKVEKVIFYSHEISVISSIYKPPSGLGKFQSVELVSNTLDGLISEQKINDVKLIKIDAECHDLEVLKGGLNLMAQSSLKFVIVEFGIDPDNKWNIHINTYIKFFGERGFVLNSMADWGLGYEPVQYGNALFFRS